MSVPGGMQSILDQFLPAYRQHRTLSPQQSKVMGALRACRTAALGGHLMQCEQCGFAQTRYHSCRNRHCPQCQQQASQQWCEQQLQRVIPVDYFHLVFTLPHELNGWVQLHPEVLYKLLFQAVWATLKKFGADPKRLHGQMGMTAILHSWGQNLFRHVHLHCLLPGGALSHDQGQWHAARSNYLFPVRALSRVFRAKMVSGLRRAWQADQLSRVTRDDVDALLNQLMRKGWVVYSKATLHHAKTVVKYLSRYTHKIATSNQRLLALDDKHVVFRWHDYRDGKTKSLQLAGEEFIRRFLLHVLPNGLMRIRHCVHDLAQPPQPPRLAAVDRDNAPRAPTTHCRCPQCHHVTLRVCYEIGPKRLTEG
ncbi:MAG: IS91 family transposase [Gammaproteobacteria bacterium]|nr:IS91 family transposase [Gammaproteobacteria bacterium]